MKDRVNTFFARVAFWYVLFLSAWFVAWLVLGDRFWWLTLLNRVALLFFLPAVLLAPLILWQRKLARLLLIPCILFACLYGPYLIPRPTPEEPETPLRVLTYNVLFSNSESAAVADVILQYAPDFVTLQEVQPEMMAALRQKLGGAYPWSHVAAQNPYGTTAVFSRHPIVEAEVMDLEADRTAAAVYANVNGHNILVISAHLLAYNLQFVPAADIPQVLDELSAAQRRQAALLVSKIEQHAGVAILGCDCNAQETSDSYRVLSQAMQNAARTNGWRWAVPPPAGAQRENRLERLDYVFYRGPFDPVGVYIVQNAGGSDHQPVLALFDLPRPSSGAGDD